MLNIENAKSEKFCTFLFNSYEGEISSSEFSPEPFFRSLMSNLDSEMVRSEELLKVKNYFKSPNALPGMVNTALQYGKIVIDIEGVQYSCANSIYYNNANFMFFYSPEGLSFIYLSGFFSGSAIWDVKNNFMYCVHGGKKHLQDQFLGFFIFFYNNVFAISKYLIEGREFGGVIVSNPRPYHFFYDVLPGIEFLHQSLDKEALKKLNVIQNTRKSFYDLSSLYGDFLDIVKTSDGFEDLNFSKFFYIDSFLNQNFIINDSVVRDSLDKKIVNDAKSSLRAGGNKKIADDGLVIWCGITSQKRVWLNQVECIVSIFNALVENVSNLTVVIDGWTSCVEKTEMDDSNEKSDLKVFEKIVGSLDKRINLVSLIGCNSVEKVGIALQVDFFIANHSAGSLHVSRISRKKGISHLNTKMQFENQYHFNTLRLPFNSITDIETDKSSVKGAVALDYLVDFETLCNLFFDTLQIMDLISPKVSSDSKVSAALLYENYFKKSGEGRGKIKKINKKDKSAILRDSALLMEEFGDYGIALELMKQAHYLKPSGAFIKKKLDAYIEMNSKKDLR